MKLSLRHTHDDLRKIPGLALKCFVANVKPYNSKIGDFECIEDTYKREYKLEYTWSQEAKRFFAMWVSNFPGVRVKVNKLLKIIKY